MFIASRSLLVSHLFRDSASASSPAVEKSLLLQLAMAALNVLK